MKTSPAGLKFLEEQEAERDQPRYTVTLPGDDVVLGSFSALESAVLTVNGMTGRQGFDEAAVIRDHGRIIIRARGGQVWWVKRCEACDGTGRCGLLCDEVPVWCDPCSATGLVEDRPC